MAQEGNLERRCSDKALKIQAVIRGFVDSLFEILNDEDLFEDDTNVIGSVLCQTEAELKYRLQQLRRLRTDSTSGVASAFGRDDILAGSSLQSKRACAYSEGRVGIRGNISKDHPESMDITLWETLPAEVVERICAMLPLSKISEENLFEDETNVIGIIICLTEELKNRLQQLRRRLRTDTTSRVASAFERDDNLAGSSLQSKRAIQRCAYSEGGVGMCRHFCKDHPELMDITLWETLPVEVVERICAMLPLSKIFDLLKLCKPWSRLPTATNFRRFCAKAHRDLFGILMSNNDVESYRLAIYDFKHDEWFHLELSSMPSDYVNFPQAFELVFGRDGGLMCVIPHHFCFFKEPPCIRVFNPLTGDKKNIGVSSFTASIEEEDVYAILLQLIMDAEPGCYKLILVTQRTKPSGGTMYYSESYDSMSGLWSTLDRGFVYGDGVLGEKRYHVCFDCGLKKFCTPAEYGTSVRSPRPLVYFTNVDADYTYDPFYTFVRDHRFKLEFVEEIESNEEILSFAVEISESVWQNGWNEKSMVELAMEVPYGGFETMLLACTRYLLVVADDGGYANIDDEYCCIRMALYDRVTCEEVLNIPQFMIEWFRFRDDEYYITRNLHFMCDLKWDAVP